MKKREEKNIIRSAAAAVGIFSDKELSQKTTIPYSTLRKRYREPETLLLSEIKILIRVTKMPEHEILALLRG